MKPIRVAVAFSAIVSMAGWGQIVTRPSKGTKCGIRELFNRAGWEIPGLSKVKAGSTHNRWTTGGLIGVYADTLRSEAPESSVALVSCLPDRSERVDVRTQTIDVTEILRFSMNGRVFAYRITAQLMGLEGQSSRVPLASDLMLTFYDEDGSGHFTVPQYPGPELIPRLDVPAWVKNAGK